tara:strand:- start:25435 stop:25971 length:537 start_codon:yes stop_codon:yes gene_type:complete
MAPDPQNGIIKYDKKSLEKRAENYLQKKNYGGNMLVQVVGEYMKNGLTERHLDDLFDRILEKQSSGASNKLAHCLDAVLEDYGPQGLRHAVSDYDLFSVFREEIEQIERVRYNLREVGIRETYGAVCGYLRLLSETEIDMILSESQDERYFHKVINLVKSDGLLVEDALQRARRSKDY